MPVDPRPVMALGTAAFFVAFVVLLPFSFGSGSHRDWLWTALAGWVLGLISFVLIAKHRREGRLT